MKLLLKILILLGICTVTYHSFTQLIQKPLLYCPYCAVSKSNSEIVSQESINVNNDESIIEKKERMQKLLRGTNIKKCIEWKNINNPITIQQESAISNILVKRGEYTSHLNLPIHRMDEIKFECDKVNMNILQAFSLRKQLLVNKVVDGSSSRLKKMFNQIERLYCNGNSILFLSEKYDIPPVSIMRSIIMKRVVDANPRMRNYNQKDIVKKILREDESVYSQYLDERDLLELQYSKLNDQITYAEGDTERTESLGWEIAMIEFLKSFEINFVAEDVLMDFGSDVITSTPDIVVLDDLYINGRLVKWIDSKCFYGSSQSRRFLKNVKEQTKRYDNYFKATGALIYKLGFSQALANDLSNSLLLDSGPLIEWR